MALGAGQIMTQADIDSLRRTADLKPACRLIASAAQSIPDTTNTALLFGAEDIDTHNFHSTSVNTSRITPTVAGIYKFTGMAYMITGNTDYTSCSAFIRLNGVTNLAPAGREGNVVTSLARSIEITQVLVAMNGTTDYAELVVLQTNTAVAARQTNQSGQFNSTFECEFIRLP